jgi:sterol desaturase/sphingolipid hydroxylase (fatty acid hydroxylase superfamily)
MTGSSSFQSVREAGVSDMAFPSGSLGASLTRKNRTSKIGIFMPRQFMIFTLPIVLTLILVEVLWARRVRKSTYSWRESLASGGIAIGHHITNAMFGFIPITAYTLVWQHRLFTIDLNQIWAIGLLFLGVEFCYYWYHRTAHTVRWLWVTHAVHHSATYLNLSAAYRLGWTGWLSGNFLFFLPLCWLGFHPIAITMTLALNLMYQFWIHTEFISKLGSIEWILNTPSHHRVHHASNPEYLDRNYGGVLIIFDRLFGTFTQERADRRPIYGLTHPLRSHNPVKITLHEWGRLWRDLLRAQHWRDRWGIILGRPT